MAIFILALVELAEMITAKYISETDDGGQWRTNLVRNIGDELGFQAPGLFKSLGPLPQRHLHPCTVCNGHVAQQDRPIPHWNLGIIHNRAVTPRQPPVTGLAIDQPGDDPIFVGLPVVNDGE